jgi:hypothetical protein
MSIQWPGLLLQGVTMLVELLENLLSLRQSDGLDFLDSLSC